MLTLDIHHHTIRHSSCAAVCNRSAKKRTSNLFLRFQRRCDSFAGRLFTFPVGHFSFRIARSDWVWTTMFASLIRFSRTTYRGAKGSGAGSSRRTTAFSSPASRPTYAKASLQGLTFKRAQRGLYDGKTIQSGNSIPKSRQKTLRKWVPNVQHKKLWSDVLGVFVQTRVSTSALRTMDKLGGLDRYLANASDGRLGQWGRDLRKKLALKLRENRLRAEQISEQSSTTPPSTSP